LYRSRIASESPPAPRRPRLQTFPHKRAFR